MANLGFEINRAELPESSSSYDPIPAGWYTGTIAEAGLNQTKAGTGQYIKLRFDVTGPSHQGRVVFTNLNIQNPNPKAEEIGRQQLNEVMAACGLDRVTDTDQFVGRSCSIKVSVRKDEQYGDSNEVKGYKAVEGSSAPAPATSAPAASVPPWKK